MNIIQITNSFPTELDVIKHFEKMNELEFFIISIGLIAIAATIVYYMVCKKINLVYEKISGLEDNKVQDNTNAIIRHNRTIEIINSELGITDIVNARIKQAYEDKGLIAHKNKH